MFVRTDSANPLDVNVTGSILADDIDNADTPTAITATQDGTGKAVLRVVDAAPHAYETGDNVLRVKSGKNAMAHESLTVDNTVGGKAFTGLTYGSADYAFITCETAQIRFTVDGTAPTTTVGHLLNAGDILKLDSNEDIVAFRAIRTGATSGVLKATFSGVA